MGRKRGKGKTKGKGRRKGKRKGKEKENGEREIGRKRRKGMERRRVPVRGKGGRRKEREDERKIAKSWMHEHSGDFILIPMLCIALDRQLVVGSLLICEVCLLAGKARRLKQAKEEAQQEIEVYRQECEKQYREHEARVSSSSSSL